MAKAALEARSQVQGIPLGMHDLCCQVMHVTMAKAAPWTRLNRMRPNRLTCTEMDQNAMRTIYSNNNLQLIDGKSMDFFTFFKFIL